MLATIPQTSPLRRKPTTQALDSKAYISGRPAVLVGEIERMVRDLITDDRAEEISRVIGRRLRIPEARVDRIMGQLMIEHGTARRILEGAVKGGLQEASEGAAEVWA